MCYRLFSVLIGCLAVSISVSGLSFSADCPDLGVVQNFDVEKFTGTWFQYASFNNFIFQGFGNCSKAEYTLNKDNGVIQVKNSMKIFGPIYSMISLEINGTATLTKPSANEGKMTVILETAVGKQIAPLWVLDTDYENYAILFSCKKMLFLPFQSSWVMTRSRKPDDDTTDLVEAAISKVAAAGGPDQSLLKYTPQINC